MKTLPPCENCGELARSRCSRCKAISICSKECMSAIWKKHKRDCDNIVNARELLDAVPYKSNKSGAVSATISPDDFLAINQRTRAVYIRHGINDPPAKGSTMDSNKKLAFFLDMLREHDTSDEANRTLPLPTKLLLNRRYNNTYRHAVDTFTPRELERLHALMQSQHIGAAFK